MAASQVLRTSRTAEESDVAFLCNCPNMELLSRLVVPKISSRWDYVGLQLGVSPERLKVIEREHFMKMGDCCTAMFAEWLWGAPGKQHSWESVLSAVETGHGTEVEGEIREGLREVTARPDYPPADPDGKDC